MSKFRYGSSFLMTTTLYISIGVLYLNFLNSNEVIKKKSKQVIKIAIITPIPKVEPKPIIKPKPVVIQPKPKPKIKKPKPKPKPKIKKTKPKPKPKIKKPKYKPKPKKIVKKIKPKPVPKEVYIEPIVEEIYIEPKIVSQPKPIKVPTPPPAPPTPKVDLRAKKEAFKQLIRNRIVANKRYPAKAKRRRITGTVHVVFDIEQDGTASNIRTSGASSILQKAVKRSLRKSFPVSVPQSLVSTFPMRNVSVNIDFKLQ